MSEFEFPTNIKQIGSIGTGIKIYMEDYVCSYLQQYAASGGYDERIAFLVGRQMLIDSQTVLFISGAIQGKDTTTENGALNFSSRSIDYAKEQLERYFEGLEIVGWMQSQPGYGTFLNSNYANYHIEVFKKPYQVLFVIDPIERINSFFYYDSEESYLTESKGYFVYYEKNLNMHEYMLQNKVVKLKMQDKVEVKRIEFEQNEDEPIDNKYDEKAEKVNILEMPRVPTHQRTVVRGVKRNTSEQIPQSLRKKTKNTRLVNMLAGLSAVLIMVCVVMAAGLMQNDGRITLLEGQLIDLNTLYKNMLVESKQNSSQPVFAAGEEGADEEYAAEQPAEVISEAIPESEEVTDLPQAALNYEDELPQAELDIPETYIVQQGDNLSYISMKFYGDKSMVDKIMELNQLDDQDTIYFGRVIKLPKP